MISPFKELAFYHNISVLSPGQCFTQDWHNIKITVVPGFLHLYCLAFTVNL